MGQRAWLGVAAVLLITLTACTSEPSGIGSPTQLPTAGPEAADEGDSPSGSEPTDSPTDDGSDQGSATTGGPYSITYDVPDGLEITLPDGLVLGTPESTAVDAYVRYMVGRWAALTTNEIPPDLAVAASGVALSDVEDRVAAQIADGFTLGGTLAVAPTVDSAEPWAVTVCADQSDTGSVRDGEFVPSEDAVDQPQYIGTYRLLSTPLGTVVDSYELEFAAC